AVVAVRPGRSQSDNSYAKITVHYGPERPENLPRRRPRAELLARGGEGAPDAAGGQPGGPAARDRAGRAAVRSFVEERDAHRGRADAPELRPAAGAAGGGDRGRGARGSRPAPRPPPPRPEPNPGAHPPAPPPPPFPTGTPHSHPA